MNQEHDPVYNVLDHLTVKFGSEQKAREEVRQMSLADVLIQNEYVKRGPKQNTKMVRRK